MKTRRKQVSNDGRKISRSSKSKKRRERYSETLPIDLIIEILSRLPAKSVTRFRCVSKLWDSLFLRPHFTELYLKRSLSRPKLLFSCENNGEFLFFSSPQTQKSNVNSSLVRPESLTRLHVDGVCRVVGSVSGLVCVTQRRIVKGRKQTFPVICNPSTGQSLLLPKVKTRRVRVTSFFGYDPIEKQFKVLSMTSTYLEISKDHQVLTLGTQKPSWRMIECNVPHYPDSDGICINGGLYYQAISLEPQKVDVIVCFDMNSEKFSFINKAEEMVDKSRYSTLVNYKGKLGVLWLDGWSYVSSVSECKCFEMWVLENAEKHEWSKHIYVLPSSWKNLVGETTVYFAGMTGTNDIVMSSRYGSDPFYVLFYNIERNSITRLEIQGTDVFKKCMVHTSLDHAEDVRLM